jgi:pilus assembly protein CpaE
MLRSILISPDGAQSRELAAILLDTPEVEVVRTLSAYPAVDDLLRIIRVRGVDLMFLCVDDFSRAEILATCVDDLKPGLPIITVGGHSDPELAHKLMRLGIREHLTSPIDRQVLATAIDSVRRRMKKMPATVLRLADLYTFLPAKPGAGASTIAVNTSHALADDLGARTLLLDCHLAAGTIKFLLKLGNSASIVDAIGRADNLDEDMWCQMMGKWGKLDVLHAGRLDSPVNIDLPGLHRVLAMARSQYEVICADLASSLDPFSLDMMRESRRIFLVTTPEVLPLHLAGERVRCLSEQGLGDRISLLLNRKDSLRESLADGEVARLVGMPVAYTFTNDYVSVQNSILKGSAISYPSDLGRSIQELAHSLVPHLEPKENPRRRKFLEFFHVPRLREADGVWHD